MFLLFEPLPEQSLPWSFSTEHQPTSSKAVKMCSRLSVRAIASRLIGFRLRLSTLLGQGLAECNCCKFIVTASFSRRKAQLRLWKAACMLSEEQDPSSRQNLVCHCWFSSLFSLNSFRKDGKGSKGQNCTSFGWRTAQQVTTGHGGQYFSEIDRGSSRSHHRMNHFPEDYASLTLQAGKKLESCQETNLWPHPLPKDCCTGSLAGTGLILLGQTQLLALEVTNTRIPFLDLTAISDTGVTECILQARSHGVGFAAASSQMDPGGS